MKPQMINAKMNKLDYQKQARQGGYVRSHDIYGGSYDRFDLLQGSGLYYG